MLQEITLRAIDDYFQKPTDVVDELGHIDQEIKQLESRARELKAKLIERGQGIYEGVRYRAEVQEYDRNNISALLVKEYGTKEFVQQVTQVQHVKAVTVKPLGV
jgi:N-acetyl-gamma-glutamylphosphate reductase